jgi:radical SAM-linked protein
MVRDKYRIRFRKHGDLRLISHHDLMRCFERMLRRAALPFHSTEGFNPKPRLVFALSLALGIEGHAEVVELELDESLSPEEVQTRLAQQAPAGLEILAVRRIVPKTTARPERVCYRLPVPPERRNELPARVAQWLAEKHCWIERTRPQRRRLDLRAYVRQVRVLPDGLEIDLWITPQGTARPEEIVQALELGDLLEAGAVLQRTLLELSDE